MISFLVKVVLDSTAFDCLDFCSHQIRTKRELRGHPNPWLYHWDNQLRTREGWQLFQAHTAYQQQDWEGGLWSPGSQSRAYPAADRCLLPASVDEAGARPPACGVLTLEPFSWMRPDAELHIDHFCPSPFCLLLKAAPPAPSWLLSPPPAGRSYYMKRSAYQFSSEQRLSWELRAVQWGEPREPVRCLAELRGWNPETQVHLLAVSTWQTEFSSRVVLTLGNNVSQLPDINIAPRSNSRVSTTWGRGKPNKISCQKLYFCQHYISSSIYQEGSGRGFLWCAKSNALFCFFRLALPFLLGRFLCFLKKSCNFWKLFLVQWPHQGIGMALVTDIWSMYVSNSVVAPPKKKKCTCQIAVGTVTCWEYFSGIAYAS